MSDPGPTARKAAHEFLREMGFRCTVEIAGATGHTTRCDRVTAAIERDRAASNAREYRLREVLEAIATHSPDSPCRSCAAPEFWRRLNGALAAPPAGPSVTAEPPAWEHKTGPGDRYEPCHDGDMCPLMHRPVAPTAGVGAEACECALPGVGNPVDCLHPLRAICQCACHSPVAPAGTGVAPDCIGECELGKCLRCWGPTGTGGGR